MKYFFILIGFMWSINLSAYYQIITSLDYVYDNNIYDFSNLLNDEENYSQLSVRLWWHKMYGKMVFAGDMEGGIILYPYFKLFRHQEIFSSNWSYSEPALHMDRGTIMGNLKAFYWGIDESKLKTRVGLFPLHLAKLSFSATIGGVSMAIPIIDTDNRSLVVGVVGGAYKFQDEINDGWIVEGTPYGRGFPIPDNYISGIWVDNQEKDMKIKLFAVRNKDVSNYGFEGVFSGKRGRVEASYSISREENSAGDAFFVKLVTGKENSFFLSYAESSGYDYLLDKKGKQTEYNAIYAAPFGGVILGRFMRKFSSVSVFSGGGNYSIGHFFIKGAYYYYEITGYNVPAQVLGSETDIYGGVDLGYLFWYLDAGSFQPGKGIETSLQNFANTQDIASPILHNSYVFKIKIGIRY